MTFLFRKLMGAGFVKGRFQGLRDKVSDASVIFESMLEKAFEFASTSLIGLLKIVKGLLELSDNLVFARCSAEQSRNIFQKTGVGCNAVVSFY